MLASRSAPEPSAAAFPDPGSTALWADPETGAVRPCTIVDGPLPDGRLSIACDGLRSLVAPAELHDPALRRERTSR